MFSSVLVILYDTCGSLLIKKDLFYIWHSATLHFSLQKLGHRWYSCSAAQVTEKCCQMFGMENGGLAKGS